MAARRANERPGILELTIGNTDREAFQKITGVIASIRERVAGISHVGRTIVIPLGIGENQVDVQGQVERAVISITRAINKSIPTLNWNYKE